MRTNKYLDKPIPINWDLWMKQHHIRLEPVQIDIKPVRTINKAQMKMYEKLKNNSRDKHCS